MADCTPREPQVKSFLETDAVTGCAAFLYELLPHYHAQFADCDWTDPDLVPSSLLASFGVTVNTAYAPANLIANASFTNAVCSAVQGSVGEGSSSCAVSFVT